MIQPVRLGVVFQIPVHAIGAGFAGDAGPKSIVEVGNNALFGGWGDGERGQGGGQEFGVWLGVGEAGLEAGGRIEAGGGGGKFVYPLRREQKNTRNLAPLCAKLR